MSTLSVPLTPQLEEAINKMVRDGVAENKASVVRRAIRLLEREEAINAIFESRKDMAAGRVFEENLRKLVKKFEGGED